MSTIAEGIRRGVGLLSFALVVLAGSVANDAAAAGVICTSHDTFLFGNRAVGSSTTANATVTNCGDAPWSFTDVSVHPATGPAFHVSTTCATGSTLAPGGTCTVSVRFEPTTPGQTSGGLWLHNSTSTPDQLITFYGRGVNGDSGTASLAFVPASADFAAQTVGTESPPLRVELHNQGPAALTLSAIVLNGPEVYDFDYGLDDTCQVGTSIKAGASCHKSLIFRPQAAGTRRANLVIDSPQLTSLAIMQVSGVAQVGSPNYTGMFQNSPAGSETGWGINFTHQGDVIFASWFTYDADSKPYWVSMTAPHQSDGSFMGPIDRTAGPPFSAVPYDPTEVTHATVGTGRLTFNDANTGTFSYTLNGVSQVKPLTRFVFAAPVPACTFNSALAATQAVNYQNMWAVPNLAEAGWGINFTHQGDVIFASWFIYDVNGSPLWVSATLTKIAAQTYAGTLDATTGPPFNSMPFDSSHLTHSTVGTAAVTFADGNNGTFAYTLNGVSGTKALTRFVFRAPGTVCQ
jgi:hypothetical protein